MDFIQLVFLINTAIHTLSSLYLASLLPETNHILRLGDSLEKSQCLLFWRSMFRDRDETGK